MSAAQTPEKKNPLKALSKLKRANKAPPAPPAATPPAQPLPPPIMGGFSFLPSVYEERFQSIMTTGIQAMEYFATAWGKMVGSGGRPEVLDAIIMKYHPSFHHFALFGPLSRLTLIDSPVKLLLAILAVTAIQTLIPFLRLPLGVVSRCLGAMFIFHTARIALQRGFLQEGGGRHAQALLSAILVTSAADLISPHLIDLNKSFGALWTLVLPLVMLLVWAEGRMVALESGKILTAVAEALHQHNINPAETTDVMLLVGGGSAMVLYWVGFLGPGISYTITWSILAFQTVFAIASGFPALPPDMGGYTALLSVFHNLLAIWVWRMLISAVESLQVPGLFSIHGLLQQYLPSYFLWTTLVFLGMVYTPATRRGNFIWTWHAVVIGGEPLRINAVAQAP